METQTEIESRGEMAIMDITGDTKIMWDRNAPAEVETARASFDKLKAKGYLAYTVKKNGDPGEQIHAFDPAAEKIIMSPPLVGG